MNRRVVVTGIGAVSPVGNSAKDMWQNMKQGVNGIDEITILDTSDMPVKMGGEIKNFDPKDYMDAKLARRMDKYCWYGMVAGSEAMEDANFGANMPAAERFGILIGSGIGGLETAQNEVTKLNEKGFRRTNPLFIPMMIGNMASGNLAIKYGLKGHNTTVTTACASATHSIGDAFRIIRHGYADAMIAGGAEGALTPLALSGFCGLKALSLSTDKNRASIPFDLERNGFVVGEGAGALVLEEYESAKKRGAKIYAEVLGYGATADAYHMTAPHPEGEGAISAMRLAVEDGGIAPDMVEYINAHGTSTQLNDKAETYAVHQVFGAHAKDMCMSSTKSMTGHLLGAAGAIEAVATVMTVFEDFMPPTINYKVADPECDIDCVPNEGRAKEVNYALTNSFAFGGHNATLLFGKVK
ncbi:MAG: beta-ketoacyl-ACP synthase II [Christensenellaceae bacterium]|jgi:3-oxoacyl-[acyl-carrier-protein] synthase II